MNADSVVEGAEARVQKDIEHYNDPLGAHSTDNTREVRNDMKLKDNLILLSVLVLLDIINVFKMCFAGG